MSSDLSKVNLFLTTALLLLVVGVTQTLCASDRRKRETMSEYQSTENKPKLKKRYYYSSNDSSSINSNEYGVRNRRWYSHVSYAPACPSNIAWQRLFTALSLNGQIVDLVQDSVQQYFLTVTCQHYNGCRGIDTTGFHSGCQQEYGYTYALIYSPRNRNQQVREIVQFANRCSCYVAERET